MTTTGQLFILKLPFERIDLFMISYKILSGEHNLKSNLINYLKLILKIVVPWSRCCQFIESPHVKL